MIAVELTATQASEESRRRRSKFTFIAERLVQGRKYFFGLYNCSPKRERKVEVRLLRETTLPLRTWM